MNWPASKTGSPPRGFVCRCSDLPLHSGVSTPLLLMPLGMVPSSDVSLLLSSVTGKPGGEARNPGNRPARSHCVKQRLWIASSGNVVVKAGHEVVAHVEGRKPAAERRIDRIHRLGQAGGLIDGLRVGVAGQQFQAVGAVIERGFQRVVACVGDGALQLDAAECRAELRCAPPAR